MIEREKIMKGKNFLYRGMVGLLCSMLLLCAVSCAAHYADTNGETDFSLQTLTEADILSRNNYLQTRASQSAANNNTKVSVGKFSGVRILHTFRSGTHTLTVTPGVTAGNFRLVLCTENRILHDFALTGEKQTFIVDASAESVFFKAAGESAAFSLDYVID